MTDTKSISTDKMTDKGVSTALKPCLEKLQSYLAQNFPNIITTLDNDHGEPDRDGCCDGIFLGITYKKDTIFKVVGSEWHSLNQRAFINVVQVENVYIKAYRGQLLECAEVDGSTDLEAEFLDWYEWLESVITNLLEGNH